MKKTVLMLRHIPHEPGGTIETAFNTAGIEFQYVDLFEKVPETLPLADAAGLVVLGGYMNVDEVEKYPFLLKDIIWIQEALSRQLPLLGICLGAQLLAKALGAKVRKNHVKEIGWYPVEFLPAAADDPLIAQSGVKTVFQWHGDTFDIPQGAVPLARSWFCENQAFRYGQNAYGLQFHIEMTAKMIDDWLTEPTNRQEISELKYINPEEIRRRTPEELPKLQSLAGELLGRFAKMCVDNSRPG